MLKRERRRKGEDEEEERWDEGKRGRTDSSLEPLLIPWLEIPTSKTCELLRTLVLEIVGAKSCYEEGDRVLRTSGISLAEGGEERKAR